MSSSDRPSSLSPTNPRLPLRAVAVVVLAIVVVLGSVAVYMWWPRIGTPAAHRPSPHVALMSLAQVSNLTAQKAIATYRNGTADQPSSNNITEVNKVFLNVSSGVNLTSWNGFIAITSIKFSSQSPASYFYTIMSGYWTKQKANGAMISIQNGSFEGLTFFNVSYITWLPSTVLVVCGHSGDYAFTISAIDIPSSDYSALIQGEIMAMTD